MRLYIDEDLARGLLVRLLRNAGHDVEEPSGAGLMGSSDPVQFRFAIRERRVCLTANYDDFQDLHLLVKEASGNHSGVSGFASGQ